MKKINPFKKRPQKEEIDDSQLSSWQKENVKFLKREDEQENEQSSDYSETILDIHHDEDVFLQKKYTKPTEIDEDDEPLLTIVKQEKVQLKEEKSSTEELLQFEKEQLLFDNDAKESEQENEKVKAVNNQRLTLAPKVKWQVTALISVIVLSLLLLIYYVSPLSQLNRIQVEGNHFIPAKEIIADSQLKKGDSFISQYHHRSQIEQQLKKKLPQLKSIHIERQGLQNITIKVEEYPLSGYLIVQKIKYVPILTNGSIINQLIDKKPNSVLYAKFKQGRLLSQVMASYRKVPEHIRSLIQQITLTPSQGNKELVTLYMKDGNKVKVSGTEMAERLKYYDQVTKQMKNKGIVDMEVGIYSYPYGNEDKKRRYRSELMTTTDSSTTDTTKEVVIPDN